MRGTDTAHDPIHDVYLLVGGNGPIYGVFVNSSGHPVTADFKIMDGTLGHGHFPRAQYSQHVSNGIGGQGGFLVTWHHNVGTINYVFGRLVSYALPGRLVSGIQQISDGQQGGSWWETGPAMAYSATSRRFLVAWRTLQYGILGRFVDTSGLPGAGTHLENVGGSRDPALAWNAATDEFGLAYAGFGSSGAFAAFRRIRASDGFVSGRTSFGFSGGTFATGIDVNAWTNQYVLAWALHPGTMTATFDPNGTQLATSFVTDQFGADQSLGLAFNASSGTFLAVGQHHYSLEIAAAEVKGNGQPNSTAQIITDGSQRGSFYPLTAARAGTNQWDVVYSRDNLVATNQIVATSSTGGGSGSGAPPPPSGGSSTGCSTPDPFVSLGGGTCVNGGWIVGGGGGGSTGGCTTASPGAGWRCVNGGWLPPSAGGSSSGGCTTPDPFASIGGGTCVNGGWRPGGSGGGGASTGGCTTSSPGAGWTCVNGGWLPPSGGGSSSGGCTTSDPFTAIGGGTCINGGWVPGGSGGGGGGSTGGCTTASPGAGWSCVNGGWLPPTAGSASLGGCTTPDPFASIGGGTCLNGGWVPTSSSCTTPDPFVSLGGGVCSNGGWRPR